jgi:hypothetical protein
MTAIAETFIILGIAIAFFGYLIYELYQDVYVKNKIKNI